MPAQRSRRSVSRPPSRTGVARTSVGGVATVGANAAVVVATGVGSAAAGAGAEPDGVAAGASGAAPVGTTKLFAFDHS